MTGSPGRLWVTTYSLRCDRPGRLSSVDLADNEVAWRADVGFLPNGVAYGFGSVWVLDRITVKTAVASCPATQGVPRSVQSNNVVRMDPRNGHRIATIPIRNPGDIAIGAGSVWVTVPGNKSSRLLQIDPGSNRIVRVTRILGRGPALVAATRDAVWVATAATLGGPIRVTSVDPSTGKTSMFSRTPGEPGDLAASRSGLWIATAAVESVVRIDPSGSSEAIAGFPNVIAVAPTRTGAFALRAGGRMWEITGTTVTATFRVRAGRAIFAPGDLIWVGTPSGLVRVGVA